MRQSNMNDSRIKTTFVELKDNCSTIIEYSAIQQIAYTFLFGVVIHLFFLTNCWINHDSIVLFGNDFEWLLYQGKWFVTPIASLEGPFDVSYISLLIGILAFSVSSVFFCITFKIKNVWLQRLVGLCFVSFPAVTAMALYHAADYFGIAFLLSVVSAFFLQKDNRIAWVVGVVLLTLSIGSYQAFLGVALTIMVLDCLIRYASNENYKGVTLRGVRYIIQSMLAAVLYYIILQLSLHLKQMSLSEYKGISNMSENIRPSVLMKSIPLAYKDVWSFLVHDCLGIYGHRTAIAGILLLIVFVVILIILYHRSGAEKSIGNVLLGLLMILFLPAATNSVGILSANSTFYYISVASFSILFVSPVAIYSTLDLKCRADKGNAIINLDDNKKNDHIVYLTIFICLIVIMVLVIVGWIIQDNTVYHINMLQNKDYEVKITALTARIQGTEGYTPGCNVVLVGDPPYKFLEASGALLAFENTFNTLGFGLGHASDDLYSPSVIYLYMKNVLSVSENYVDQDVVLPLYYSVINEMATYPQPQSIRALDGKIVVKLSDNILY